MGMDFQDFETRMTYLYYLELMSQNSVCKVDFEPRLASHQKKIDNSLVLLALALPNSDHRPSHHHLPRRHSGCFDTHRA